MQPEQPGSALAVPAEPIDTGLGDLTTADIQFPRLKIVHSDGVFEDPAMSQQYGEVFCVVLGLVRQRILWHTRVENDEKPMCKSPDFLNGYPNLEPADASRNFPFAQAGFNPDLQMIDEAGRMVLPCGDCKLKEWGSHPQGGKPYCSEQFTLPVLYAGDLASVQSQFWTPALVTFQKTGITPAKRYLGAFQMQNKGAYTAITRITLATKRQGNVTYSTPIFQNVGETDPDAWPEFSEQFRSVRTWLISAKPRGKDIDGEAVVTDPNAGQPVTTQYVQPVQQQVQQAQPQYVQPQPVQPAVQQAVTPPPAQRPFTPPARQVPTVQQQPAPVAQPAPTPQPSPQAPPAASPDDDDLPF